MHIAKLCHFWAHAVEIRRKNHMSHGQFNLNLQETSNHHLHAADSQTLHSSWRFWNFLKFWSSQTEYWSSNFRSYKLCACCVVIIASTSSHMISRSHFEACTHTQLQVKNQEPVVSSKLVIRVQFVNDRWIFSVTHIYVIKSPLSSKPTKKFHSNFFYLLVFGQCDVTVTGPSLACIIFGVHELSHRHRFYWPGWYMKKLKTQDSKHHAISICHAANNNMGSNPCESNLWFWLLLEKCQDEPDEGACAGNVECVSCHFHAGSPAKIRWDWCTWEPSRLEGVFKHRHPLGIHQFLPRQRPVLAKWPHVALGQQTRAIRWCIGQEVHILSQVDDDIIASRKHGLHVGVLAVLITANLLCSASRLKMLVIGWGFDLWNNVPNQEESLKASAHPVAKQKPLQPIRPRRIFRGHIVSIHPHPNYKLYSST